MQGLGGDQPGVVGEESRPAPENSDAKGSAAVKWISPREVSSARARIGLVLKIRFSGWGPARTVRS
jgi:hypothetical protein